MNDDNGDLKPNSVDPTVPTNTETSNPILATDSTTDTPTSVDSPTSSSDPAVDPQRQPSAQEATPIDPVDVLDSEPSTKPAEPNPQPFADKPQPAAEPASEPTSAEATPPVDSQPSAAPTEQPTPAPQPANPAVAAAPAAVKSKKFKKQKQPKAAKPGKAAKQPKNRSNKNKSSTKKVLLTILITILLLAAVAAALWFFVFSPQESNQPAEDSTDTSLNQQVPERTPANSAELAIDAIQTALHADLDELYPEMYVEPATPDSSQAAVSPSYQVDGADYTVSTDQTYSLQVAPDESYVQSEDDTTNRPIDPNFVEQVGQTASTVLATNNYTEGQTDPKFGLLHESTDVICSVMTESLPNQIVCVDKSSYKTASDNVNPYATAFLADNQDPAIEPSFYDQITVTASQTEGYEIAEVSMLNATGLFYRQLGQDWQFFTGTQQILECSAFDSEAVQAAFAGEKCLDPVDNPTNKPTTVAEYYAES